MAAVHLERGVRAAGEVDALLRARNAGRGLEGHAKEHGRAGRDAAERAAGVVRHGRDGAVHHAVRVVVLAAAQARRLEAAAELDALHGGHAKRGARDEVLDAVEHGRAHARRHARGHALYDAADGVELAARVVYGGKHGLSGVGVYRGEGAAVRERVELRLKARLRRGRVVERAQRLVAHVRHAQQMGAHAYAALCQHLERDAAGGAQGRREPAREVAAAGDVLVAVPLCPRGVVGVARARHRHEVVVVARAGVRVLDHDGERRAARGALWVEAAHDAWQVRLLARRRPRALAGCATRHETPERLHVDHVAGGEPLHDAADGRGVRLSEHGDPEGVSKG